MATRRLFSMSTKSSAPSRKICFPLTACAKIRHFTSVSAAPNASRKAFIAALPILGAVPTCEYHTTSSVTRASTPRTSLRRQSEMRPLTASMYAVFDAALLVAAAADAASVVAPVDLTKVRRFMMVLQGWTATAVE